MQYQVQIDPHRLLSYGVTVPQIVQQLANNNANAGGGFYSQGGQFYYVRGLGLVKIARRHRQHRRRHAHRHSGVREGRRHRRRSAHAPRLGQFGYMHQNDAVEGVILMRVGEQAQVVLKKVEELTDDAEPDRAAAGREDRAVLRPHRADSRRRRKTVERNLVRGMVLVLVVLGMLPVQRPHGADRRGHDSVRAAVLVHLPRLGAHPGQPAVDRRDRLRHDRRRRGRHGREHLPRAGRAPRTEVRRRRRHPRAPRKDVERPIFYAIAVIIAGYLPIYVLTGPSGRLFRPMADTMAFALLGVAAVLADAAAGAVRVSSCASTSRSRACRSTSACCDAYDRLLDVMPAPPRRDGRRLRRDLRRVAAARAVHRRGIHAAPRRRLALGPRDDAVHDFVRRSVEARAAGARACCSSFPQVTTVANELGRPDDGTDPIGFFNDEYFVGLKPYDDPAWRGAIRTKAQLIDAIHAEAARRFPASSSTTRSRPKTRSTKPRPVSRARWR